jgi:hypothetical protein
MILESFFILQSKWLIALITWLLYLPFVEDQQVRVYIIKNIVDKFNVRPLDGKERKPGNTGDFS